MPNSPDKQTVSNLPEALQDLYLHSISPPARAYFFPLLSYALISNEYLHTELQQLLLESPLTPISQSLV